MEDNTETLRESFEKELAKTAGQTILDPALRRKKILMWTIRAILSVILYILFWKYDWVKYTLYLTVPLSLASLFTITVTPWLLSRKIEKARRKIDDSDKIQVDENTEQQ